MTSPPPPGKYEWLSFNAPMSSELADALAASLARSDPKTVLDIGCGWGELLLRVLAAAPSAHGVGVEAVVDLVHRGRRNARERHLGHRADFRADLPGPDADPADVVICVGADHIFGTQAGALRELHELLRPGGRLLLGTGFWEAPPTVAQAAALGATPDELRTLPDLVDLASASGFRLLDLRTATRREWEQFEFGYLADSEEWLVQFGDDVDADEIRLRADRHRTGYLRGYRDVLGFAYLTLGRPTWS